MDVIPVIDVRHGVAVAAARGDRAAYKPLITPLADGCDPVAVALGYAGLFTFPNLYVADLDAIEGRGANVQLAAALSAALPGVRVWVDAGLRPADAARAIEVGSSAVPVAGSESMVGASDVDALGGLPPEHYVLSLDFRGLDFVGPPALLEEPERWADNVIVMTLARVGAGEGPDIARVADIVSRANGRRVYAAGGVRDLADVEILHEIGASGVLVASALHAGKIKAGDLDEIAGL